MTSDEIKALIKRRRRQLIVHSYGYYRLNDTIIDDYTFDRWCNELVKLQSDFPELAKQVELHDEFEDFDGSTGFDLPTHLPWVAGTWSMLKRFKNK